MSRTLCLDESTLECVTLTESSYCMHRVSHFHSNLVTTLPLNIHLTPESVPNQNSIMTIILLQNPFHPWQTQESIDQAHLASCW